MIRIPILLAVAVSVAQLASAQSLEFKDEAGNSVAESNALQSRDGFGGFVAMTPFTGTVMKMSKSFSSKSVPAIAKLREATVGTQLMLLVFFANPKLTDGKANVMCDVKLIRPDGSISIDAQRKSCFQGAISDDVGNFRMARPSVGFIGTQTDVEGLWKIEVTLVDKNRGVEIKLSTSFIFVRDLKSYI